MIRSSSAKGRWPAILATAALSIGVGAAGTAWGAPTSATIPTHSGDDYSHPLGKQMRERRQEGLEAKLKGKMTGSIYKDERGDYVELEREGEDPVWTLLVDYSNFPMNSIEEPDRNVNNTTHWQPDFSRDHFMDLMFSEVPGAVSVRNFYIELSANRYTIHGDVTEWVNAPGTAESYDDDAGAFALWQLIIDGGQGWYDQQIADGMTPEEIDAYLSQFDVWDRYDYNGNGNFDEPDGYIDHFQIVHAGEGEEAGGGALGGAAIWSHRWYTYFTDIGVTGPGANLAGGVQVGQSSYWIGDYTIEPENGGVGVFAHEYGHDLGLPDLYATQGGANSTGFWTLMSSGSWLGDGTEDIGTRPGHMGAWEKFQLGWLNYEVGFAGSRSQHTMGPADTNTNRAQGLFVVLPDKEVTAQIGTPYAGDYMYYSGSGDDLSNTMEMMLELAPGTAFSAMVNFDIETDWDYAYLAVSMDGGANWTFVESNLSTNSNPNGTNLGNGITGNTGGWVELTADLSAYEGEAVVAFAYITDAAVSNPGFLADEIMIGAAGPYGAEVDEGWALNGFRVTTGEETASFFNAYVAEFRQYRGYDLGLQEGPYNFGFQDNPALGNYVEHFPYQDGLLISYWDTSFGDNNTPQHPGGGLILPIDAHPTPTLNADGIPWRPRIQGYDSTFGLDRTDGVTLHTNSVPSSIGPLSPARSFMDTKSYWDPATPWSSVIVPPTGTEIKVQHKSSKGEFMRVQVRPALIE